MNELKNITLSLENMEEIKISSADIIEFKLSDISYEIERIACNSISDMEIANYFHISIKCGSKAESSFNFLGETSAFDRLTNYDDICGVNLEFLNGTYKYFLLNWTGDNDNNNEAQTSFISKDGDLYIMVNEFKKVKEIFDDEYLKSVDFLKTMYEDEIQTDDLKMSQKDIETRGELLRILEGEE